MKQFAQYLREHGPVLTLSDKEYTAQDFSSDGDIALGTLTTARSTYTVMWCPLTRVAGHPDAEVWSVMTGGRRPKQVALFAVDAGTLRILH